MLGRGASSMLQDCMVRHTRCTTEENFATQVSRAWAGSIVHTDGDRVTVLVSEEKMEENTELGGLGFGPRRKQRRVGA